MNSSDSASFSSQIRDAGIGENRSELSYQNTPRRSNSQAVPLFGSEPLT